VYDGVISGGANFALVKSGAGKLTLAGANSFSGGSTINAGTLQIGNSGAAGTPGNGTILVGASGTLTFLRNDTAATFANAISGSGSWNVLGTGTTQQSAYTFSGNNSGFTGALVVDDARMSITTTANAFPSGTNTVQPGGQIFVSGGLTINQPVTLNGNGWLETSYPTGLGALRLSGSSIFSGNVTLGSNTRIGNHTSEVGTISGAIIGSANLEKFGPGTITLSGSSTGFTGLTTHTAGTLNIASANALGTTANGTIVDGSNGSTGTLLQLTAGVTVAEPLTLNGLAAGRAMLIGTNAAGNWSGPITINAAGASVGLQTAVNGFTVSGDISGSTTGANAMFLRGASPGHGFATGNLNLTSSSSVFKTDTGTWTLGAAGKTYNWGTLTAAVGTLNMGAANVTPAASTLNMGQTGTNSPTLNLNGFSQTVGALNHAAANTSGTHTIINNGPSPAVLTIANTAPGSFGIGAGTTVGVMSNGSSTLGLTIAGTSTYTLAGTSITYSGPTTITSGTLSLASTTGFASSITNHSLLQLGGSSDWTFSNSVTGSGSVEKIGADTITLPTAQTYTGKTTISQGKLRVLTGNEAVLGTPLPASDALFLNGGVLSVGGVDLVLDDAGRGITVGAGNGTLEVDGSIQLTIAEDILAGGVNLNKTGAGTLNLTKKTTAGTFSLQSGTVNLQGGTLRFDNFVQTGGSFNWGTGALGVATLNDNDGTTEYSSAGYQSVRSGYTASFGATLTSEDGSGLLLHGSPTLYLNNGVRFNNLTVAGDLILDATGDYLEFEFNPYLLRPFSSLGSAGFEYGSLPMVTWSGNVSGTFDTVTGITTDTQGFTLSSFAVTDGSALDLNTYFLEYDSGAKTLWFHYKVSGYVPEPGTFGMMAAGVLFFRVGRSLRDRRRRVEV
jgi:autotransporter-associated beta strand protein